MLGIYNSLALHSCQSIARVDAILLPILTSEKHLMKLRWKILIKPMDTNDGEH